MSSVDVECNEKDLSNHNFRLGVPVCRLVSGACLPIDMNCLKALVELKQGRHIGRIGKVLYCRAFTGAHKTFNDEN